MVIQFRAGLYAAGQWDVTGMLGATGLWSCNHDSKAEALASLRRKAQNVVDTARLDVWGNEARAILRDCDILEACDESKWPVKGLVAWPGINYHTR